MSITPTRTVTYVLASSALAVAILAAGSGAAASGQPTSGKSPDAGTARLLAGDIRVWELTHEFTPQASVPMAGDVRVWDLIHSPSG